MPPAAGALVAALAAAACPWSAHGQVVNGAITGHQHSGAIGGCNAPDLGGANLMSSPLVVENDQSLQTSVQTISTTGVAGHTTYQVTVHMGPNAENCYAIYGDSRPLMFPPAYQVDQPFGANVGGVSPLMYQVNPLSQYDSWLTIGEVAGNSASVVSSIGIDFTHWDVYTALVSAVDSGGAVFWMNPDHATPAVSAQRTMVVAQLTLNNAQTAAASSIVHFDAQGRSIGHAAYASAHIGMVGNGPSDWEENCIEVLVGGPQNGQGSHSTMSATNAPMVQGGACIMMNNPQGGSWNYNMLSLATGTAATLQCMVGFIQPPQSDMSRVCQNGQWMGGTSAQCMSTVSCRAIQPLPLAGSFTYTNHGYTPGSYATLTCAIGWNPSSNNVRKVCSGGLWVIDNQIGGQNPRSTFASCQRGQTTAQIQTNCANRAYDADSCYREPTNGAMRTESMCRSQGVKCQWRLEPAPGSLQCHACVTPANAPPGAAPELPSGGGGAGASAPDGSSSSSTVVYVVIAALVAGGAFYAQKEQLGPFAPKSEKVAGLTDSSAGTGSYAPPQVDATIYDTGGDDTL